MSVTTAGKDYVLTNDNILEINSPQSQNSEVGLFGNPHVVVAKCKKKRWAIVALTRRSGDEDDATKAERRLGIRWFHKNNGHPVSRIYAVWFILPEEFHSCIAQELKVEKLISEGQRKLLLKFLKGKVVAPHTDGKDLKKEWKTA